jgi:hypothetical protein
MVWRKKYPGKFGIIEEFKDIERWFGTDDRDELVRRYDDALATMDGDTEVWLRHSMEAGVTAGSLEHFQRDWVDGDDIAADGDHILNTIQSGFAAAMTAARDNQMRMSIIWMEGGSDFAVDHVVGGNGVTVVMTVPDGTVPEVVAQSTA